MGDGSHKEMTKLRKRNRKKRNCCSNCWRMSTHTKVISQTKLYKFLAEQSTVLGESTIFGNQNPESP